MRLLLAEGERELANALRSILKHNNYPADVVFAGQDALDYGLSENYDGIILDIMMPKLDGLTVQVKLFGCGKKIVLETRNSLGDIHAFYENENSIICFRVQLPKQHKHL